MKKIKVFIYGSCHYTPGRPGGYGVVITVDGERVFDKSEAFSNSTHGRMDVLGLLEGLKNIPGEGSITIYLANDNVIHSITKGWICKWKKKGFKKIKHKDLWIQVEALLSGLKCPLSVKNAREVVNNANYCMAERLAKKASYKLKLQREVVTNTELKQ